MNRLCTRLWLLAFLPAFVASCKKDADFSPSKGDSVSLTVFRPTCRLNAEGSDDPTLDANQFTLAYDKTGNLQSVLGTKGGSGTVILNTTVSAQRIDVERDGIGVGIIYDFDQDIFSGRPGKYTATHAAVDSSLDKTVTLTYDDSGRISTAVELKKSTAALVIGLDIDYDQAGNVAKLTYSYGTSTVKGIYTISGFDSKHNPYDSLRHSPLLMYNWDLFNSGIFQAIQHLSRNNPKGYSFSNGTGSTSATFDYKYNDHGYPEQATEVISGGGSPVTTVWTYKYDCL